MGGGHPEGYLLCGNPEEVCEQVQAYQDVGCDQVAFGTPDEGFTHDQVVEMIEVFGTHVIPEFDTDPVHSTTRSREQAQRLSLIHISEPTRPY